LELFIIRFALEEGPNERTDEASFLDSLSEDVLRVGIPHFEEQLHCFLFAVDPKVARIRVCYVHGFLYQ
jgi:hypothetical protein